jgi:Putative sensor
MDIDTSPVASPTTTMPVIDSSDAGRRRGECAVPAASGPAWWRRLGRDSAYTLTSLPLSVLAVVLVAVLVSLGVGLAVLLVGLPILALGLFTARGFAFVERRRLGRLLGTPMAHPTYLSSQEGDSALRRVTAPARDPQSWLDVAWTVVAVFTATVTWAVAVAWWAAAIGGTTYGIWEQAVPRGSDPHTLASLMGFGTSERADILVISAIGVFALLTLPFALRAAAVLHSTMGRDLLCGRAELQQEVRRSEAGGATRHG